MDWVGSALLLLGTYFLAKQNRLGWILNALGSGIMIWVFLYQFPILILNAVFLILAVKGYLEWRNNERTS